MGLLLLAYLAVQYCCSECWCDYCCWLTWRCSIVVLSVGVTICCLIWRCSIVVLSVGGTIVVGLPGGAALLF